MRLAFHAFVHFHGAFEDQEEAAGNKNKVAARKAERSQRKQRLGQLEQSGDGREKRQAHDKRQRQADEPGAVALSRRELIRQDGDENKIVDTQKAFTEEQIKKAKPT